MLINRFRLRIEWGDCDAAGIVFYPRYFAWFDAATFRLFARTGLSMRALWQKYGAVGTPLVAIFSRLNLPGIWFPSARQAKILYPHEPGTTVQAITLPIVLDAAQSLLPTRGQARKLAGES